MHRGSEPTATPPTRPPDNRQPSTDHYQQRLLLNATAAAFPLGEIISLQQLSDTLHILNEIEGEHADANHHVRTDRQPGRRIQPGHKATGTSKLGHDGLNLASQWEDPDAAEAAVLILRQALQDAGFNPR